MTSKKVLEREDEVIVLTLKDTHYGAIKGEPNILTIGKGDSVDDAGRGKSEVEEARTTFNEVDKGSTIPTLEAEGMTIKEASELALQKEEEEFEPVVTINEDIIEGTTPIGELTTNEVGSRPDAEQTDGATIFSKSITKGISIEEVLKDKKRCFREVTPVTFCPRNPGNFFNTNIGNQGTH
ncbi:hypothetical protein ACFE04_024281 [Oxalis oulophora]